MVNDRMHCIGRPRSPDELVQSRKLEEKYRWHGTPAPDAEFNVSATGNVTTSES